MRMFMYHSEILKDVIILVSDRFTGSLVTKRTYRFSLGILVNPRSVVYSY